MIIGKTEECLERQGFMNMLTFTWALCTLSTKTFTEFRILIKCIAVVCGIAHIKLGFIKAFRTTYLPVKLLYWFNFNHTKWLKFFLNLFKWNLYAPSQVKKWEFRLWILTPDTIVVISWFYHDVYIDLLFQLKIFNCPPPPFFKSRMIKLNISDAWPKSKSLK